MTLEETFEGVSLFLILKEIRELKQYIKESLMSTETDLVTFINNTLLPAWAGVGALGQEFLPAITALEAQISQLQAELVAACTPTQVDTAPAIALLQNLASQMTAATTQGTAELNQMVAPVNAASSTSSTAPGAPAPSSATSTAASAPAISGAPATAIPNLPAGNASTGTVPASGTTGKSN